MDEWDKTTSEHLTDANINKTSRPRSKKNIHGCGGRGFGGGDEGDSGGRDGCGNGSDVYIQR